MDRPKAKEWQAVDSNRDEGDTGDKSRRWVLLETRNQKLHAIAWYTWVVGPGTEGSVSRETI